MSDPIFRKKKKKKNITHWSFVEFSASDKKHIAPNWLKLVILNILLDILYSNKSMMQIWFMYFYNPSQDNGWVLWFHVWPVCVCPSIFSFPDDNWSKCESIFTKLCMCINMWRYVFGLLIGKFCQFLIEWSAYHKFANLFPDNYLSKYQWIFTNLVCAFILWRSGLGLLMYKFCQFLTELSACHMIVAGLCHFTFLFAYLIRWLWCHLLWHKYVGFYDNIF